MVVEGGPFHIFFRGPPSAALRHCFEKYRALVAVIFADEGKSSEHKLSFEVNTQFRCIFFTFYHFRNNFVKMWRKLQRFFRWYFEKYAMLYSEVMAV